MPVFWVALLLILVFSINLRWLPATGDAGAISLILPAAALGLGSAGLIARLVRSSMLEVLRAEYITTSRAKGLGEGAVILGHALRNALIPLITIVGLQIGNLLSGAVVIETIFARQGLGSMLIRGIMQRPTYDHWETKLGCTGWGYESLLPHFKAIESKLGVVTAKPDPFSDSIIEAAGRLGYPANPDYNGGPNEYGAVRFQFTMEETKGGLRRTTSFEKYIGEGGLPTLTVETGSR